MRRDGGVCQRCQGRTVLQAHHIYPKKKRPKMRYVIENGITLCVSCHFWIERVATDRERIEFIDQAVGRERADDLYFQSRDMSAGKTDFKAVELWLRQKVGRR